MTINDVRSMDLIPKECIDAATVVLCKNSDTEKISWGLLTYDSTEKKYCFSEANNYDMVKSLMDTFWDRNSNLEVKMSEEEWNRRSAIINAIRNLNSLGVITKAIIVFTIMEVYYVDRNRLWFI